jgi:hypothetical protein
MTSTRNATVTTHNGDAKARWQLAAPSFSSDRIRTVAKGGIATWTNSRPRRTVPLWPTTSLNTMVGPVERPEFFDVDVDDPPSEENSIGHLKVC